MQWIKVPLILAVLLVMVALFQRRQRVEFRAGSRLLALGLGMLAVLSVAFPGIPQAVADRLGVARGTDLILYMLIVVFVLTSLGLYFRLREADERLRRLARSMAIERALNEQGFANPSPEGDGRQGDAGP
ncbi:MAG: DUF2304 domain-containing protein [Tetrasphaera sp.]|nr:DUF2304 domain-containing protein [Tetrasphaera sp.]